MKAKVLFLLVLATLFVSCRSHEKSKVYQQNKQELLRVRKISKQRQSIAGEAGMDSLLWFFDKQGTQSDRFMAHFYYAHYLKDAHVYGSAYKEFVKTLSLAPKTKSDVEIDMLRSIFSNLQGLCRRDHNVEEAAKWWEKAERAGVFSHHFLYDLYYNKAYNFLGVGQNDSCIAYLKKSYDNLIQVEEWDANKCMFLEQLTVLHALMGNTEEFKKCFALLQKHPYSGDDACSNLHTGLIYAHRGMRDSADVFLRRALNSPQVDVALEAAVQLAISFRHRNENDSVFAYFQKVMLLVDRSLIEREESYTREIEVATQVLEKEMKIVEQRNYILALSLFNVLLVLFSMLCYKGVKSHLSRRQIAEEQLSEAIEIRNALELQLQTVLEEYELYKETQYAEESRQAELRFNELIVDFGLKVNQKRAASQPSCRDLLQAFTIAYPATYEKIKNSYPRIKSTDYIICILASKGFSTSQIAILLDYESSEIYHFMLRISKGLSGRSIGRIKEFKALLDKYFD